MVRGVILYAGRDHGLVQLRRLVLQGKDYVVDTCDDIEDFVRKFLDGDYDLVLLCNSLRQGERERLISLVHRFSRRTPVLLVCSSPAESAHHSYPACTGEPQAVLRAVGEVLAATSQKRPVTRAVPEGTSARAQSQDRSG